MEKARRPRHVPAFGEWNYYSSSSSPNELELPPSGGAAPADWWYAPEPEACSDVWFRYSPPPRKPAPKRVRRREVRGVEVAAAEKLCYSGGKGRVPAARARASDSDNAGGVVEGRAQAKGARKVLRPVDEDLYRVPPPDSVSGRPRRKRAARSLWMGCLGVNCVA
ncbi:uncharacterized protein LOC133893379 [Phragmites australis]|uniref:uncharacterized protein LOC133893379 n=1 Tax=Phragmites australis TaxID=29695 RepID=UPI002D79E844|nr:uncharacterized protein LOC133893379 [Phragmites australis]